MNNTKEKETIDIIEKELRRNDSLLGYGLEELKLHILFSCDIAVTRLDINRAINRIRLGDLNVY